MNHVSKNRYLKARVVVWSIDHKLTWIINGLASTQNLLSNFQVKIVCQNVMIETRNVLVFGWAENDGLLLLVCHHPQSGQTGS